MATKTKNYGTKLSYSATGSVYTDLTDLISVTPPTMTRADVKVSHLESASQAHEYLAGWVEGGEVAFVAYFAKSQFNTLFTSLLASSDSYYWKVTFPLISGETSNSTLVIRGHLKEVAPAEANIDDDGKLTVAFKVKTSGLPTFTQGS